ncbi:MAG TPA: hypothetical protein VFL82_16435 [Thermomicrobiales bacterium]|nr:hypothetical protein [Thermomicrobiales bacterium]
MSTTAPVASPFDPYLYRMLAWGSQQPNGFSHPAIISAMVDEAGWQAEFSEAVFTSARARGLIGPHYGTRSRGRVYWEVSRKGRAWFQGLQQPDHPTPEAPSTVLSDAQTTESTDSA